VSVIGVDIGGTFTDVCCIFEDGGERRIAWTKEPTTPGDPVQGVVRGVAKILAETAQAPGSVERLLHGTTVGTNAVLERKGARIGVLMTDGFEDTLELGRGSRTNMYRLDPEPETPGFLASGRLRRGVPERISATGQILVPLDEAALRDALADLVERQEVEALAVCYLFSFANPVHELRTRALVEALYPGVAVSLSHEVDPLYREYERVCMTGFDAYLRPVMSRYLERLSSALREAGLTCDVLTMQSRGSLASTRAVSEQPVVTLLSGPAAGVTGAVRIAQESGYADCITLDVGGTSADIALVTAGKPIRIANGRIGPYPLRTPMVDLNTIGAGGGSIAWIDKGGGLRVGPHSAGSIPGPACYGRGGREATVTDASLVLGYLDPARFAGGIRPDVDAAHRAIETVARPLGLSIEAAAAGIHRIVNARMADEIRLVSLRRGFDPRHFILMLFGGGGPVCGWAVARELEIGRALVPFAPGALCAYGLTAAAVEYESAATVKLPAERARWGDLAPVFAELSARTMRRMVEDAIDPRAVSEIRSADMRYIGQSYELSVPIAEEGPEAIAQAVARFVELHRRVYGHASDRGEVEFVNLRIALRHALESDAPRTALWRAAGTFATRRRRCWFPEAQGFVDTQVVDRAELAPGDRIVGPAIIHQSDATTVMGPASRCTVDSLGNLLIERA
jgi:N-methylhydantoinase A